MYSGKTTRLLKVVHRRKNDSKNVKLVKAVKDGRYGDTMVVTHDGSFAEIADQVVEKLEEVVDNAAIICIDELHFYQDAIP